MDFTSAILTGADFAGADLRGANLSRARLEGANLSRANLTSANLGHATLEGANLSRANLAGANLSRANLAGANLSGTHLSNVNFSGAYLSGADFTGAGLASTLLVTVDLSPFCEARSAIFHFAPSPVDYASILRSIHAPGLKEFLARTGMPEVFVEYMVESARSLKEDAFSMLQSTFISYGSPDEGFARKLYEALHRNGVTTFFFPEHAVPGKKLHRLMRDGVNKHDRVLLICSEKSLTRPGVLNEIEETLAREANDSGAEYLIPIRLDNYIFSDEFAEACNKLDKGDFVPALRRRVIGDFRDADKDDAKFTSELLKVIAALKK